MSTWKMTDQELKEFRSIRKQAAQHIDPETAEVEWIYVQITDPYGIDPDLPEVMQQVGRGYFARAPGSDIWVWFGDLPEATSTALWERHKQKLAFPAGLSFPPESHPSPPGRAY
jgi:hypothetical protein